MGFMGQDLVPTNLLTKSVVSGSAVGIGAGKLSEREKFHRGKHKQKILAEMKSYAEVKGKPGILPGFGFHGGFPEEIQSAIVAPAVSLITVAEKIARGLEFKIAGK